PRVLHSFPTRRSSDLFEERAAYRPLDLNGDGWVDLVRVGVARVFYALAEGAGVFGEVRTIEDTPAGGPETTVHFADMNGSGTTEDRKSTRLNSSHVKI